MHVRFRLARVAVVMALVLPCAHMPQAHAQEPPNTDFQIDSRLRTEVIEGALKLLAEGYIFPERAPEIERAIRARQRNKEYDTITSGRVLAQVLTEHLREASKDQHLAVSLTPTGMPPQPAATPATPPSPDMQAIFDRQTAAAARQNFGFAKVERLAGNIGYIDLRNFMPAVVAGDTAAAAISFVANTDAVIFDLRENGGGDPGMVALVASYLFGAQPVHLNDLYNGLTRETRQSWTLPYVPGKRLIGKDVYVLTGRRTFSAGEEFAYNLKQLKRATLIGETTEGGAHLVTPRRINDRFIIDVPIGRPIHPITKGNWEGVGVEPDVKVSAADALRTAHLMALEAQQRRLPVDAVILRNEVTRAIAALKGQ